MGRLFLLRENWAERICWRGETEKERLKQSVDGRSFWLNIPREIIGNKSPRHFTSNLNTSQIKASYSSLVLPQTKFGVDKIKKT